MPIEVILQKEVPGLGAEADLVKVKPGYARNYLIPQKLALPATDATKRQIEVLKQQRADREAALLNEAEELARSLTKATVTFQMETHDDSGKLFGSVTNANIAERLATMDMTIDRHKIDLDKPLKDLGEHDVTVHLPMGVQAKLKVVLAAKTDSPS